MICSSQLSQSAKAENGIEFEEIGKSYFGDVYDVIEIPIIPNKIEMDLSQLQQFCNRSTKSMPLFRIRVMHSSQGDLKFPVRKPYYKFFTIWNGWMFYSLEPIEQKESIAMEGGEIHV